MTTRQDLIFRKVADNDNGILNILLSIRFLLFFASLFTIVKERMTALSEGNSAKRHSLSISRLMFRYLSDNLKIIVESLVPIEVCAV